MKSESLQTRILKRIDRKRGDVFLRSDFKDLGGYDQVGRVLRDLVREGRLLKLGHGLYTRAVASPFDGTPAPIKGLRALAAEALDRLGVESAPTRFEQAYNSGQTTQVPAGRVIAVRKRGNRSPAMEIAGLFFCRMHPRHLGKCWTCPHRSDRGGSSVVKHNPIRSSINPMRMYGRTGSRAHLSRRQRGRHPGAPGDGRPDQST